MDPLFLGFFFIITLGALATLIILTLRQQRQAPQELQQSFSLLKQELLEMKQLAGDQRKELYALQTEARKELTQHITIMNEQVGRGLSESHRSMQTQFSQTSKLIEDVTQKLATLDSTNKQVLDFSSQLQKLQDILKNPKQRGILGEYYLETLLKNVLPPESYAMQYKLGKNGEGKDLIPDAVVFVKDTIIPIDSKFSLENYNRCIESEQPTDKAMYEKLFLKDIKGRIQETAQYIQPEKGTTDFAFMFIPHEALYYDLLTNKIGGSDDESGENILQRAASKYRVILVSPTNFLAYLQTILQALNALKIEKNAEEIKKYVKDLHRHFSAFADVHDRMGKNLSTAVSQYNQSADELRKLSRDVLKITSGEVAELPEMKKLEKPELGE